MAQKICPICDQVMKSAHYCRTCKSWVKHPYVREATYYLNERHPQTETQCSYHDNESLMKAFPHLKQDGKRQENTSGWTKRQTDASQRQTGGGNRQTDASQRQTGGGNRQTPKPAGKRPLKMWVVVVILIAVRLLGSCANFAARTVEELYSDGGIEYDTGLEAVIEEEMGLESDVDILEDHEVIEAGIPCTRNGHFDTTGEAMAEAVYPILEQRGVGVESVETYSYNERYADGSTWYSIWDSFKLVPGEQGTYQYLELDYDTATNRLHHIYVVIEDPETLARVVGDVLAALEEQGAITAEENCGDLLMEELPGKIAREEDWLFEQGCVSVEGLCYYDGYTVTISCIE